MPHSKISYIIFSMEVREIITIFLIWHNRFRNPTGYHAGKAITYLGASLALGKVCIKRKQKNCENTQTKITVEHKFK